MIGCAQLSRSRWDVPLWSKTSKPTKKRGHFLWPVSYSIGWGDFDRVVSEKSKSSVKILDALPAWVEVLEHCLQATVSLIAEIQFWGAVEHIWQGQVLVEGEGWVVMDKNNDISAWKQGPMFYNQKFTLFLHIYTLSALAFIL